MITIDYR